MKKPNTRLFPAMSKITTYKRYCCSPSALLVAVIMSLNAITDLSAGELPGATMLANTCAGCHGTFGSSVGPASPTIAGMSKDYFIETMMAYKNNDRPSTIMSRIAKGYSEEEIKLMAGYFSKQKFVRFAQEFDTKKASRGKKLHKKYCHKCHEENGALADDDAGILAGQWTPYLRFTMTDLFSGNRSMWDKKKQRLDKLIEQQGEQGVEQLIHFYASQK